MKLLIESNSKREALQIKGAGASPKGRSLTPLRVAGGLLGWCRSFVAEGFYWIEAGGAACWVEAGEETYGDGEGDGA